MKSYFKHLDWIVCLTSLIVGLGLTETSAESSQPNTLSQEERAEGWVLLWDGHSFDGWRAIYKSDIPKTGWIIENDTLICLGEELPREQRGGGILTDRKYKSFELRFEFKLSENGNSGIKYFVDERLKASPGHALGLEYAMVDHDNWPYDRPDYNRTTGSLYELVRSPEDTPFHPVGEWNTGRIIVKGNHIEHWLNGHKTVDIEKGSPTYLELVKKSKYVKHKGWGEFPEGHIFLQDEGPRAAFRNLKIRELE